MKKTLQFFVCILMSGTTALAQVGINSDNSTPAPSAGLDVKFNNKGFLMPRMTTVQIGAIINPANGLQAYNTDDGKVYVFVSSGNAWKELSYGAGTIAPPFVCGNSVFDSRDGQSYPTVLIGTQCWFARNLNVGTRIIGSVEQANNVIIEKYCYNDLESNCTIYGGLYEWGEIVQYLNGTSNTTTWNPVPTGNVTGLCPAGWHLPKDAEWTTIVTYLSGEFIAGGMMKETGTAHWYSPNTGANNISGYAALGGGNRSSIGDGSYIYLTKYAHFWTASEYSITAAFERSLNHSDTQVGGFQNYKKTGSSCRCVQD